MWLLWISIGVIIGASTRFIKLDKKSPYLRRGILIRQYSVVSSYGVKTDDFECQLEVGELERTDKKSKIKIINYIPSGTKHSTESDEQKVRKLIDNSWIESSKIEWISNSLIDERNEKLSKILN